MENTANEELDFGYYINIIFKRFWLIAGMAALGLLAAILVNIFMRPAYKASALIMINQEDAGKIDSTPYASFSNREAAPNINF